MFGFHTIKSIFALLGADWGCQTGAQAMYKQCCWRHRVRHVGLVALVQLLCAWTAPTTWGRRLLFVGINAGTHYLVDSVKLHKAVDQTLHLAVVVVTAPLLKGVWL